MDLVAAHRLARALLLEHGLSNWTFKYDRAARRFGSCAYRGRTITLSWKLTMLNDEPQVRNTILHEIAHALAPGAGHGPTWRAACARLGIEAERCFTAQQVAMPARRASRYEVGCPRCAWWHPRHRLGGRTLICKACHTPVIYRERATSRCFRLVRQGRRAAVEWIDTTAA